MPESSDQGTPTGSPANKSKPGQTPERHKVIKETECCGRVGPHAPDCKNWGQDRVIEYEEEMVLLTAAALAAARVELQAYIDYCPDPKSVRAVAARAALELLK